MIDLSYAVNKDIRIETFHRLKDLVQPYEKFFIIRVDKDDRYELWSEKEIIISSRKRDELNFVSIIIHNNYVGFYFMPIYVNPELIKSLQSDLVHHLKGKNCFHITLLSPDLENQIKDALEIGFEMYKKQGWV